MTEQAILTVPITPGRDHTIGLPHAQLQLVEYGDYECPFCGMAHPIMKALIDVVGNELLFAYRHFPIATAHPHARNAAEAAEAAGAQDLFWEMHDRLYTHQHQLTDQDLVAHAAAIGADTERFVEELAAHVHAPHVREDFMSGVRSGVNGTPSVFMNGVRYDGPSDLQSMLQALEAAASMPLHN
jgi:protein-disulfide isomerase